MPSNLIGVFLAFVESQEQLRKAIPKYANIDQRPPFTYASLIRQVGHLTHYTVRGIQDSIGVINLTIGCPIDFFNSRQHRSCTNMHV